MIMKKIIPASVFLFGLTVAFSSLAQSSMELEEACFMDVDLTNYIVQVIETGASGIEEVVTSEEADQISSILAKEEVKSLSKVSEKLTAVLKSCAEGSILQTKNNAIINPQ
jgi:hypothetical protein